MSFPYQIVQAIPYQTSPSYLGRSLSRRVCGRVKCDSGSRYENEALVFQIIPQAVYDFMLAPCSLSGCFILQFISTSLHETLYGTNTNLHLDFVVDNVAIRSTGVL